MSSTFLRGNGGIKITRSLHKMLPVTLAIILTCGLKVGLTLNEDRRHCDRFVPRKDVFKFTEPGGPATLAIGCIKQWLDLVCCVSKYKTIKWYQTKDGGTTWTEFKENNKTRHFTERHQVANIDSVDPSTDQGSFKCVAEGFESGERLENTVYVDIRNCSSWSGPPVWLNPRQEVTQHSANLGDNITIPCKTLSGTNCHEDIVCNSYWSRPNEPIPSDNASAPARVRYTFTCWPQELEMESDLIITGVREEDFGSYNCSALNGNEEGWAKDRLIILRKEAPPDVLLPVAAAIVGAIVLCAIAIATLAVYQTRVDLDLKIWWARRRFHESPDTEGDVQSQPNILLINSFEDERFAQHLKQILMTKFNFTATSSNEGVNFNEASVIRIPKLAHNSNRVLVLMTPELTGDRTLLAAIREVISQSQEMPVFVQNGDHKRSTSSGGGLDSNMQPGVETPLDDSILGAMSVNRPLTWPGVTGDDPATLEPNERQVDWQRRATARQAKVFWKQLHLSLLRKTGQGGNGSPRRVRNDSTQPLLQPALVVV